MKLKGWQLAVIIIGLLVGGASVVWSLTQANPVSINMVLYCVDAETGDLYMIDAEKYPTILPARHPKTNKIALVRVTKDENGKWHVAGRDMQTLNQLDQDVPNNAIDPQTGELKLPVKEPITYVRN